MPVQAIGRLVARSALAGFPLLASACGASQNAPAASNESASAAATSGAESAPAAAPRAEGAEGVSSNPHAEAFLAGIEASNRGKIDEALASFSDDTEWLAPSSPEGRVKGREPLRQRLQAIRTGFPDNALHARRLIVSGDRVVAQLVTRATHTGEFMGIRPSGKTTGYASVQFSSMKEGKKQSSIVYLNPATLLTQLGVMSGTAPEPPALPAKPEIVSLPGSDAAKKTIESFVAAYAKGKLAEAAKLLASDLVVHDHVAERDLDRAAFEQELAETRKAFPDLGAELEDAVAAGNFVAVRVIERGTHKGPIGPLKATGKAVTLHGADVYRVEGGKIAEVDRYRDVLELYRQIGLLERRAER